MLEKLGVQLIRLDLPFRLNHVNCFLAEGETGWTIVDAGLNNQYTRDVWEEKIGNKKVTDIYITHYHPDHYGYAGGLQEKTGAAVTMSAIDADAGRRAWTDEYIEEIQKNYHQVGVPSEKAQQMTTNNIEFREFITPHPKITNYFEEEK